MRKGTTKSKYVSFDKWFKVHLKEMVLRAEEEIKNMQPGSLLRKPKCPN